MKYSASSQRQVILPMAFLLLMLSILNRDISSVKWISLTIFIICFLLAFLKYTLIINKHTIVYAIQLFGLTIYSKEIVLNEIKEIIFKRTGWISKLAVIKLYKGLSIRVALFKPEIVYDDLVKFCEDNTIHYEKTKDYKIIEK